MASEESNCKMLKDEVDSLKKRVNNLVNERTHAEKEVQQQQLLLYNLECIKQSFEMSESNGKQRLEKNLEELSRECNALRFKLQEESEKYQEQIRKLKEQNDSYENEIQTNKTFHSELKADIENLNKELSEKSKEIVIYKQKLESAHSNEDKLDTSSLRQMEMNLKEKEIEIESLKKEIKMTREHCSQYCQMAEALEAELKDVKIDMQKKYDDVLENLKNAKKSEEEANTRVEELEFTLKTQFNSLETDQNLQVNSNQYNEILLKLKDTQAEVKTLREKCNQFANDLRVTEEKYANEMILHSADIQSLASLKQEYQVIEEELHSIKFLKDAENKLLQDCESTWKSKFDELLVEKKEIDRELNDLKVHNDLLHKQLTQMNENLKTFGNSTMYSDDHINESSSAKDIMQVLSFVRKEKDLLIAKLELSHNEKERIAMEFKVVQEKYDDLVKQNAKIKHDSENMSKNNLNYENLLRKLETINAITDSNRLLREERDNLVKRLNDMTTSSSEVEKQLQPLKEKNFELSNKIEQLNTENSSLRVEATRWRQRANLLTERSCKTNTEGK